MQLSFLHWTFSLMLFWFSFFTRLLVFLVKASGNADCFLGSCWIPSAVISFTFSLTHSLVQVSMLWLTGRQVATVYMGSSSFISIINSADEVNLYVGVVDCSDIFLASASCVLLFTCCPSSITCGCVACIWQHSHEHGEINVR